MAQAFDLAGAKNIVGAPSFAHLAKGGDLERMRRVVQLSVNEFTLET